VSGCGQLQREQTRCFRITVCNTNSSSFRYSYKYTLSATQLSFLYGDRLSLDLLKFTEVPISSLLNPTQRYERFCFLLKETIAVVSTSNCTSPRKKRIPHLLPPLSIPAPWWNNRCAEATEYCMHYDCGPLDLTNASKHSTNRKIKF